MSNIALLPLYEVHGGVQASEDWGLTFFIAAADGVTPIDLTGIAFTAQVESYAPVVATGDATGIVNIAVAAADKADWLAGCHRLAILATASDGTFALVANSYLTVGAPRSLTATRLDTTSSASASVIGSDILAAVFASIAALPNEQRGDPIPPTGQAYISIDGIVSIAQ